MLLFSIILLSLASWLVLFRLFPNRANDSPECGGGGGDESEARRQEDVARQSESAQNELNQFLAQLNPNSPEFNQLQAEGAAIVQRTGQAGDQQAEVRELGQRLVTQQGERIGAGGAAGPLEERTNLQIEALRGATARQPFEEDILRVQRGEPPTTPLGRIFAQILGRSEGVGTGVRPEEQDLLGALRGDPTTTPFGGIATDVVNLAGQDPDLAIQDEFSLIQDQINRDAQARGVVRGGLPVELSQRAGAELAVRTARERENIRRNRLSDVLELFQTGRITQQEALQNVGTVFDLGQQLRVREIGLEEAVTDLQSGRESRLTELLGRQTGAGTENLLNLFSSTTGQSIADRIAAQEQAAAQRAALGTAIGTGLGAAVGGPFGAAIGGQIGGGLAGGGVRGTDPTSLLAQRRSAVTPQGQPVSPSAGISRGNLLRDFTEEEKNRRFQLARDNR